MKEELLRLDRILQEEEAMIANLIIRNDELATQLDNLRAKIEELEETA